jgi:SAM-dependent methyltransferase
MLEQLRGHGIKTRLLNPYDAFWDWKLGVHTFGYHPGKGKQGDSDWQVHYTPTPYADIFRLLRMVKLGPDDVFVDLGGGLGRAVFAASWLGAKRAIGVEIVEALCDRARQNVRGSRLSDRDIQFICANALDYQHRDTTVLFMFHPFGEQTMRLVLRNIGDAIADRAAQRLRIIYINPVFDDALEQSGWLQRIGRVPRRPRVLSTANSYVVSLWQSSAQGE